MDHYLYASDVFQPPNNDWTDETEAEGQPPNSNCNSSNDFAFNPTPSSLEKLQADDFDNFQLPPCHVITQVRVNVMCRYNSGFTGRVTARVLGPGIDHLINSNPWQSDPDNCAWVLDPVNDITGLVAPGAWTQALINQIEVLVGRFQVYQNNGGDRLRCKAFRIVVTTECPSDPDGDGACGTCDNCPNIHNPGQANNDGDLHGNPCDNCPDAHNNGQENCDGDMFGDACDNCDCTHNDGQGDGDSDGVGNVCDNCPNTPNAGQANNDGDIHGNVCDNCPDAHNNGQENCDSDMFGDVCDNCDCTPNNGQADDDSDGVGTACDNCSGTANTDQADDDFDGIGNVCDNCPSAHNPGQKDEDTDGLGDVCDPGTVFRLYAINVPVINGNGWDYEDRAEGNPGCGICDCNNGTDYAENFQDVTDETFMTALNFEPFNLPPGAVITKVAIDAQSRYDDNDTGRVRMRADIPSLNINVGRSSQPFNSNFNCHYVMQADGDITDALMNITPWTQNLVNELEVGIRRMADGTNTRLRVNAMRIEVTTCGGPSCAPDIDFSPLSLDLTCAAVPQISINPDGNEKLEPSSVADAENAAPIQVPVQRSCGTVLTPQDAALAQAQIAAGSYKLPANKIGATYTVPLKFHVIRTSGGMGGIDPVQLDQAIVDANVGFAGIGITFCQTGDINFIDSDEFYYNIDTLAEIDALRLTDVSPNAVNCYFTPNLDSEIGALCGISSFTSSQVQGIVMLNGCTGTVDNPSTFPHELGHYFDLFHTHETRMGVECTSGSNCAVAGDLLCDTPADPELSGLVNIGCQYIDVLSPPAPCSGDPPYAPDPHNIMSYSAKICRDIFSSEQTGRALATLINLRPELAGCGCSVFTIRNAGQTTLNVTSATLPSWLQLNPVPPYQIAAGQNIKVCVTGACDACGGVDLSSAIVFHSNDPVSPTASIFVQVDCTPPECTLDATCNDGDPCTTNTCVNNVCQYTGSCGACCYPQVPQSCSDGVPQSTCFFGHYAGDGSSCSTTNCDRCDEAHCQWCWTDTALENNCDPSWNGDGPCDCGCQFFDVDCPDCPPGTISWLDPPSGAVDARRPHSLSNPVLAEGFQTFTATGPAGAEPGCWTLCEQGFVVGPNYISNLVEGPPGTYTITLNRPITVGATTTLTYSPSGGSASTGVFISHPANVNGDSNATPFDVMELVDHLKGTRNPPLQLWQCDGDRSNLCTSEDVLTEIDLLNGAGLYTPWNGNPKPASSCP